MFQIKLVILSMLRRFAIDNWWYYYYFISIIITDNDMVFVHFFFSCTELAGKYDEGNLSFKSAWSYIVVINNCSQVVSAAICNPSSDCRDELHSDAYQLFSWRFVPSYIFVSIPNYMFV